MTSENLTAMALEDDLLRDAGVREIASPLTRKMLRPLNPGCRFVQFNSALSNDDYRRLADWLADYPSVQLRAYGSYDSSIRDLEFLRFFPALHRFSADALYNSLESIDGLGHLSEHAHTIGLGQTRRKLSLRPLERFTGLRRLYLEAHTKDIDVLAGLTSLTSLTLRSITLPDLSLLLPLTRLRALDLKLGGTRDLSLLPHIGKLEYLELWMVRGLSDLTPVASVTSLRHLFIQALKQVSSLPADLSRLTQLDTVWIETMKGLTDLNPLLTAPSLRQLALVDMAHLQPGQVAVLSGHSTLRYLLAGLGSDRKNRAVMQHVPLSSDGNWERPPVLEGD